MMIQLSLDVGSQEEALALAETLESVAAEIRGMLEGDEGATARWVAAQERLNKP